MARSTALTVWKRESAGRSRGTNETSSSGIWGSLFIEGVSKSQIDAPYLVWWRNKDRSSRHYFCPRQDDGKHGWATIRLFDARAVVPFVTPLRH
jgi:hypothetical protein